MKKVLVDYDRNRDNYLPACEVSKLLSLAKNCLRLSDKDLSILRMMGFNVKVATFDMPQSFFQEAKEQIHYPTMKIQLQGSEFIGHHINSKGQNSTHHFPGYSIDEVFYKLINDPQKPKD